MSVALGVISGIYVNFAGLKTIEISDTLSRVIFLAGTVVLILILAFLAMGDGIIVESMHLCSSLSEAKVGCREAETEPHFSVVVKFAKKQFRRTNIF